MQQALKNPPINLSAWIEANKATLKPPIGNRQFWKGDWQNLSGDDGGRTELPSRLS